jgi:multidrug efflux pump subunit AcrB
MSLVIFLLGGLMVYRTPTDVFPEIDIPVITIVWRYPNLTASDVEAQITTYSEFAASTAVNNIKEIRSETINGIAVIRLYFFPGANIAECQAQLAAVCQSILGRMPRGTVPPLILRFNASSVPVVQIAISSDTLTPSELYDFAIFQLRQQLASVQGTTLSLPFGGADRQVMVDLDLDALAGYGLSPQDVTNAITAQCFTLPTGTVRMGSREYTVGINSSPAAVAEFNDMPLRQVNGRMVYIKDVAQVRDGPKEQTSIVRKDGKLGVLVSVLKNGNSSSLEISRKIKAALTDVRAAAPPGTEIEIVSDQAPFVWGAITGVLVEAVIAAILTAVMILMFLGSWRSTLIVATSIPLAVFCSIIGFAAAGHTLNIMTLSGLALAVGILVDDATVEIENIHRHAATGKPLTRAILDAAQQVATPALFASLSISIVFLAVVFLDGVPYYLFAPQAIAVVLAVLASYLLSRTVVPTMSRYLLPAELGEDGAASGPAPPSTKGASSVFGRVHEWFNRQFDRLQGGYVNALEWALTHRGLLLGLFAVLAVGTGAVVPFVGRDFYPASDAGEVRLQLRAPPGTRYEETDRYFSRAEKTVRAVIPASDLASVTTNVGVPDGLNLGITDNSTISSADGEMLITLKPDKVGSAFEYLKELRRRIPLDTPYLEVAAKPGDMATEILNFGLPSAIDVQVTKTVAAKLKLVPGAVDVRVYQVIDGPQLFVDVDRIRASEAGLTELDVANSVVTSLASSGQVNQTYWTDSKHARTYLVAVQTPPRRMADLDALKTTPVAAAGLPTQLLGDLARIDRGIEPVLISHSNVQPSFNVRASVQGTDLASVAAPLKAIVDEARPDLPPAGKIVIRGQVESMNSSFVRLGLGILFAATLVYLLLVINFQSWVDPLVIVCGLPGAMVGIVWALWATHTTFSVPSLMGALMAVGVATSNSILVIVFANEQREDGKSAVEAALEAGKTRLRPVIMTALAMIIGMLPMSLGLSEGGEQNAPLGRAVIGGLIVATLATLFLVPAIYTVFRRHQSTKKPDPDLVDGGNDRDHSAHDDTGRNAEQKGSAPPQPA